MSSSHTATPLEAKLLYVAGHENVTLVNLTAFGLNIDTKIIHIMRWCLDEE